MEQFFRVVCLEPIMTLNHLNPPFTVIAKPIGPLCNLKCRYCFYLEKKHLFGTDASSLAAMVLGDARKAIGEQFYLTADQYFHRGVPHSRERAFDRGLFIWLQNAAAPKAHAHLEGDSIKEMLPWLSMTLRMDPENVEAFRVTAFWLSSKLGEIEQAEQILSGFSEAASAAHAIHPLVHPGEALHFEYSTTKGLPGAA